MTLLRRGVEQEMGRDDVRNELGRGFRRCYSNDSTFWLWRRIDFGASPISSKRKELKGPACKLLSLSNSNEYVEFVRRARVAT